LSLVVVPTPIGNLEDITLRALRSLREADVVACEDTRRTGRLLAHYEIEKPLLAYHEHNEDRFAPELAKKARTVRVALVSDAGTPLVSDPGYRLLQACIEAGVEVEVLPGPSAVMTALVASGLPTDVVVFLGFLPRKGRGRKELLERVAREDATFVLFESPHRLAKTLKELPADVVVFLGFPPRKGRGRKELLDRIAREEATFVLFESPHRLAKTLKELPSEIPVAVCRELTKLHEEIFRGTGGGAAERYAEGVRGEVVLVVRGGAAKEPPGFEEAVERAREYVAQGESPSRAAARAAKESGWKRNEVYDWLVRS